MGNGSRFSAALLAVVALAMFAASGCGDSDAGDVSSTQISQAQTQPEASKPDTQQGQPQRIPPSSEFKRLTRNLKAAALAEGTYKAVRQSNRLNAPEEAVIDGFCTNALQLEINGETSRFRTHPTFYMVGRLHHLIEVALGQPQAMAAMRGALSELRRIVNLGSMDTELNHAYKKACYQ